MKWISVQSRAGAVEVRRAGARSRGHPYPMRTFRFEEVNRMPEELYLYSFNEEGERA